MLCLRAFCFFRVAVRCSQYMHPLRAFNFPTFRALNSRPTDVTSNAARVPISVYRKLLK